MLPLALIFSEKVSISSTVAFKTQANSDSQHQHLMKILLCFSNIILFHGRGCLQGTAGVASFNIFLRVVNISSSAVYLQVTPLQGWSCKIDDQSSVDQQVWGDEGFQNLKQILKRNYYKFNAPFWRTEWSRALTFCNLRTKTINAAFRLIHNSQNVMFWIHLVIYSNSVRKLWCIKQNWFFIFPFSFTLCMLLLCKFFSNLTFN